MPQALKPLCLIHFWLNPFFSFSPLRGNKKWEPQYKDEEVGKILGQNQLNRLQMVQFECPRYRNPCVSFILEEFPYGVIDNWTPSMKVKKFEKLWNKISLAGGKCSSLNFPSSETPAPRSFWKKSPSSFSTSHWGKR